MNYYGVSAPSLEVHIHPDRGLLNMSKSFIAGVVAGYANVIAVHPIDVIRTAYQADSLTAGSTSLSSGIRSIARGGIAGFYKGLWPPLFGQGLYKGVIFSVNSYANKHGAGVFMSGLLAGVANSILVAPIELCRTRAIIGKGQATSAVQIIRAIAQKDGIISLWRGVWATMLRDGPGLGLYFLSYTEGKRLLGEQLPHRPLAFGSKVFAASLAGAAFWVYALPVDTVKTLLEASKSRGVCQGTSGGPTLRSVASALRETQGGLSRVIAAYPMALLRGVPASIVTLITYDAVLDLLEKI